MSHDLYPDSLLTIAGGIAREFGKNCEVCIHDLNAPSMEHTIIFIVNGHITGRKVGDGASNIVLQTIAALNRGETVKEHLAYRTHTKDGRILKSSSIFLKDESGKVRYILGINLDITEMIGLQATIASLISSEESGEQEADSRIPMNVNELLDSLIEQSVEMIGKTPKLMTKEEKIRAIQFLKEKGAFLVTRSGDRVSKFFGISKFTLYSFIDQGKTMIKNEQEEI